MLVLAPVAETDSHPALAPFAASSVSWYLVRSDDGTDADSHLTAKVAEMLAGGGALPERTWVASLEGARESIDYATGVSCVGATPSRSAAGNRVVLSGVDDLGALSLLDAAGSVAIGLVLLRAPAAEAHRVAGILAAPLPGDGLDAVDLIVVKPAGRTLAVLGWPTDRPMPLRPGIRAVSSAESVPQALTDDHGVRPRRRLVAAVLSVTVLILATGGGAAWRLTHRSASPPASPAAASSSGAVGVQTPSPTPRPLLPSPSFGPSIAYDLANGAAVVFGGAGNDSDTWVWSGQRWRHTSSATSPPSRFGAAMAYDPKLQRVLLYGGRLEQGDLMNDTWSWDGSTWSRIDAGTNAPPQGEFVSMVWDEARGEMVLLAGLGGSPPGAQSDTWAFDGRSWSPRVSRVEPPHNVAHVMGYDPVSRTVLLIAGGIGGFTQPPRSTWSWDGAQWHQLTAVSAPDGGFNSALAIDPLSGRLLLVTVASSPLQLPARAQTWSWDGHDWAQLPSVSGPTDAPFAAVANAADGVLELFGRDAANAPGPIHVWAWTGRTWARLADGGDGARFPSLLQRTRQFASTAYDEAAGKLVLYGGQPDSGFGETLSPLTDTWTFDSRQWTKEPTASHPPSGGPMAFDPVTRRLLLIADANGATGQNLPRPVTWSWTGSAWTALNPPGEITSGMEPVAIATDPARNAVVVLADCCFGAHGELLQPERLVTWTWDGKRWTRRNPSREPPAGQPLLAHDPRSHHVLAVAGDGEVTRVGTWSWDGRTWTELHPAAAAVFDPLSAVLATATSTGDLILLERRLQILDTGETVGGTQVWNGTTWTEHTDVQPLGADTAYGTAALYTDPRLGRLVIVSSAAHDFSEEWMWSGSRWLQIDGAAR